MVLCLYDFSLRYAHFPQVNICRDQLGPSVHSVHPRESIMDTEGGAESKIGIFSLPNEV